jgi:hypothetical protein
MNIELPDGRMTGGGLGGPPLWPGRLMNCSVHWCDKRVQYLVGRASSEVKRLHLDFAHGYPHGFDLEPVGKSEEFALSFFAEELPISTDLVDISAWDERGNCLERRSTAHYPAMVRTK